MQQYDSEANRQAARDLRVYSGQLKKQLGNPESLTRQEAIDRALEYMAVKEQLSAIPTIEEVL